MILSKDKLNLLFKAENSLALVIDKIYVCQSISKDQALEELRKIEDLVHAVRHELKYGDDLDLYNLD